MGKYIFRLIAWLYRERCTAGGGEGQKVEVRRRRIRTRRRKRRRTRTSRRRRRSRKKRTRGRKDGNMDKQATWSLLARFKDVRPSDLIGWSHFIVAEGMKPLRYVISFYSLLSETTIVSVYRVVRGFCNSFFFLQEGCSVSEWFCLRRNSCPAPSFLSVLHRLACHK